MSFLNLSRALLKRQRQSGDPADVERNRSLRVFLNDTRCELVIQDSQSGQSEKFERLAEIGMEPQALLAAAMAVVSPELEKRIGNVEVFIDDPNMSVVDSRQAKLSHFEGRALAEFGKYQLGGKPVCFASHRFGATSAAETEKRVVAYIPEDRLSSVLFALGKLARFTTFFGPWSLQPLLAGEGEEIRAQLTVHGDYSTLTLANDAAGAIAVRQLPVGTAKLAAAYAGAHGIEAYDALQALASRSRLTTHDWPLPPDAPARHTGSFLALAPVMESLSGEIAATGDYFEYQRLAGRAGELRLSLLGARIAGFATWLTDMLQIGVAEVEPPRQERAPVLNLLEGMRTGLLKIGNQHFDFVGGRFVPSAVQPGGVGSQASISLRWKNASSQPLKLEMFKPYAKPAGAGVLALALVAAVYPLVLSPIAQENENSFNLYANTLTRMAQAPVRAAAQPSTEPVLWAKDIMTLGSAMPYDMKLTRMALVAASGSTPAKFELTGTLPKEGINNLELIGRFMKRLGTSAALHRRFPEIAFAGAGQGDARTADGKADDESQFRLTAKVAVGAKP